MNQTKNKHYASKFEVLSVSLEVIRALRGVIGTIGRRDRGLETQIRNAASSVASNIGEGNLRRGKDRRYHFLVAAGSAEEVRQQLLVAEAWGYLAFEDIEPALALLDRVLAMLWRLTHPRQ